MRPEDATPGAAKKIRLSEYRAPDWLVEETRLVVSLAPSATRVKAAIRFRRNGAGPADLVLNGHSMARLSTAVDGAPLPPDALVEGEETLTIPARHLPEGGFLWEAETEIAPAANTALEGLYMSNGMYCTQCEAEGFRKITYYPDRPDVMAPFSVRIEGDAPVLLSNGDLVEEGVTVEGRRFAEWRDPWPKPAYLFALVAGDLMSHDDRLRTMSGRDVSLRIWVRPGDEGRCGFAMDALKRSMRWDEERYGREYDLDLFQIVAVDDFNMGAMENKGLNIFNSKYVLASPETATDADYERIEAIIAHEYFHNWTGNRITCRDWFQLCLKEGLTVFRDQQFSEDERNGPLQRLGQVSTLRARQFREDAGPLAHPVRPEAYEEINNFYTATVYEKGAELIRMLRALVGAEAYTKALDLYFERHDGQACTIEDWLKVFEDETREDLSRFALWYSQAGTPRVTVSETYEDGEYALTLRQETPPTPGQAEKAPLVIPCALGLLGPNGGEMAAETVVLREAEQTFRWTLPHRPVASLFRGFSAPVIVEREIGPEGRAFLMAHDQDLFNRAEAARGFALDILLGGADPAPFLDALEAMAGDEALAPAFRAHLLALPGAGELMREQASRGRAADPAALFAASEALKEAVAERLETRLFALYGEMETPGPFSPDAESAGRRALRNAALGLLVRREGGAALAAQAASGGAMSERLPALMALVHSGAAEAAPMLARFAEDFGGDAGTMDKWLTIQATAPRPDTLARVAAMAGAADFPWRNPNKLRALVGAFAANPVGFHAPGGEGYRFYADWLIRMDGTNPQTAARMSGAFESWATLAEPWRGAMRAEIERVAAAPGLSRDLGEMTGRMLAG